MKLPDTDLSVGVPFDATCPLCGAKFTGQGWVVVDISSRPELGVRALDGSLQRAYCPTCVGPGSIQLRTYCITYRVDEALQFLNFVPWGTADIPGEIQAVHAILRERCAAAGVPDKLITPVGSTQFRNPSEVRHMVEDTWPGLKLNFDPTLVPNVVLELLSATEAEDRIRVLHAHPDLVRPNIDRFLECLSKADEDSQRAAATDARSFLDKVRTFGIREGAKLAEVPSAPVGQAEDQAASSPTGEELKKWIMQIDRGRIRETCQEIEKLLNNNQDRTPACVINELGNYYWDQKNAEVATQLLSRALHLAERQDDNQGRALIMGNLGNIYFAMEKYSQALPLFENAADLYAKGGDSTWQIMMIVNGGNTLDCMNQKEKACAEYRKAAALAKSLGALTQEAMALGNLGNLFGQNREFKKARLEHAKALELAWHAGEVELLHETARNLSQDLRSLNDSGVTDGESLTSLAVQALKEGRYSMAREGFAAATLLYDEILAPIQLADHLDAVSTMDFATSHLSAAIEAVQKAIALVREQNDFQRSAHLLLNLSAFQLAGGRLTEAFHAAADSLSLARMSDNEEAISKALGNLGIIAQKQGRFSLAESYLQRQYMLALETKDEPQTAMAAQALGTLFVELGSIERAAELLNEARCLAEKHGLTSLEISCLIDLAITEDRKAKCDRDAQEAMYRKAIALSIENNMGDTHVDAAINLIRLLINKGDIKEASSLLSTTENLADFLGDPEKIANLVMLRAKLAVRQGQMTEARESFQAAGHAFRECTPERSADCFVDAASIAYQQFLAQERSAGKDLTPESRELILEGISQDLVLAISIYEGIARKLEDYRLWVLMQRQEKSYRLYTDVVLKLDGAGPALAAVERGKGRALRFAMYRRLAGHRTKAYDYIRAMRNLAFQVMTTPGVATHWSPEAFEASKAFQEASHEFSLIVERKEPDIPFLDERQLIDIAGTAGVPVVEFAFGSEGNLYVWVIADDTIHFDELNLDAIGGVAGLRQSISQLRASIGLTRDLGPELADPGADCPALLEKLYAVLFRPIESWLPEKEGAPVCVIPDGPLFEVPFAALQTAGGRTVLDRWSVFEIPALHFLAVTPEEPGKGFVVAGDPKTPPAAEKEWGSINRLPFARGEAAEVARLYGVTALVDSDATKEKVDTALETAELVHLAAHAVLSPTQPFDSAIVLGATAQDDGFLRVRDIDHRALQCRLFVLSCCSTSAGIVTGDGVLSLCRSLLAAGAHSVLASLWAVNDESTCFTMIDFHRRLTGNPFQGTLAEMVRQSQLATREKYPHHSQWAPFVLWGWPHWVQSPEWREPHAPVLGRTSVQSDAHPLAPEITLTNGVIRQTK